MADHILVLDGKGSVEVRRTEHDANENNTLIEELRKTDAIVEGDDSKDDNPISNQDATPKTTPKVTIKVNNAKKVERQRGDLGLYKFYFLSSGIWNYITWMFMAAINMLWAQMPRKYEPLVLLLLVLS